MKKYILRNKLTGFFFNGTNFSASDVYGRFSNGEGIAADEGSAAVIFKGELSEVGIRAIWGVNVQIIEVTDAQLEVLKESANCEARACSRRREAIRVEDESAARFAAPLFAAATRLRTRAKRLALEVYSTFPAVGGVA